METVRIANKVNLSGVMGIIQIVLATSIAIKKAETQPQAGRPVLKTVEITPCMSRLRGSIFMSCQPASNRPSSRFKTAIIDQIYSI